jgi:anti-sigma regulatory factor (Ser/Thr protein kinase)
MATRSGSHDEDARRYASSAGAPTSARRWATGCLSAWGIDELVDDASLVVSELVTNAVMHGEGEIGVRLVRAIDALRIEVSDDGDGEPRQLAPRPDEVTGRGLRIVSRLAAVWGVHHGPHGKTVWAELSLAP